MAHDRQERAAETRADNLITERALARRWQVSPRTLQRWRANRTGPAFCRIGNAIRYRLGDVLDHETTARHEGSERA